MTIDPSILRQAMTDLSGKTALVTGAGRGQGAVEAELLASCGAKVMLCDVLVEEGEALAAALCSRGMQARFHPLDVTNESAWQGAISAIHDWTRRLAILVNNAGIINRKTVADMGVAE